MAVEVRGGGERCKGERGGGRKRESACEWGGGGRTKTCGPGGRQTNRGRPAGRPAGGDDSRLVPLGGADGGQAEQALLREDDLALAKERGGRLHVISLKCLIERFKEKN